MAALLALRAKGDALRGQADPVAAWAVEARASEVARSLTKVGHPRAETERGRQRVRRATGNFALDKVEEARDELGRLLRGTERMGSMTHLPVLHMGLANCHFTTADWDDACAEAESAIIAAEQVGTPNHAHEPRGLLGFVAIHRGDLRSAEELLSPKGRVPSYQPELFRRWGWALLHEEQGDLRSALGNLEELMGFGHFQSAPDLVRVALRVNDHRMASTVTRRAEEAASASGLASARGRALRCQGLLDRDPEVLRQAVNAFAESPRVVETAFACEDAAMAFGERARLEEAVPLFDRALDVYQRARAARDASRVVAALRGLGVRKGRRGARRRPSTGWESLTETERQVVKLAAQGLTNPEIGQSLFISRTTVATHLSHVFMKLGVRSRMALAAEVARQRASDN